MSELEGEVLDTTSTDTDPGDETSAEAVEPEVVAEAWAGPQQDEWRHVQDTLGQIGQWIQGQQQPAYYQEPVEPVELDPFGDPDGFANAIVSRVQESIAPVVQPLAEKQSEELVRGWAAEAKAQVGDYDEALAVGQAFALRAVNPQLDGRQALHAAARQVKERDDRIRKEAVDAYKKSLQAPVSEEPGVSGAGIMIEGRPSTYDAIIAKHALLNGRD
jgi:hypothetical protein